MIKAAVAIPGRATRCAATAKISQKTAKISEDMLIILVKSASSEATDLLKGMAETVLGLAQVAPAQLSGRE